MDSVDEEGKNFSGRLKVLASGYQRLLHGILSCTLCQFLVLFNQVDEGLDQVVADLSKPVEREAQ